jgi:hypothetical protein
MPSRRFQFSAVIFGLAVVLGGCSMSNRHNESSTPPPPPPGPVETLSDQDAMKQVVDPGNAMVKVAGLQDVSGGFAFEACNDQGEPPYRGRLDMGFRIPDDTEPKKYFQQIATTIVQEGVGWYDGPPPGKNPFGTVVHTDTVFAVIGQNPSAREDGYVHIFGECRNMADHRDGSSVNVTDQLLK